MTFVNDALLPLPGIPDNTPAPPALRIMLIGQPQPVRIPEHLWRSWLTILPSFAASSPNAIAAAGSSAGPGSAGCHRPGMVRSGRRARQSRLAAGPCRAHLFAYQLGYGVISRLGWSNTDDAALCHQRDFAGRTNRHTCSWEPIAATTSEYELRRRNIASPLADVRGPAGRTRVIAAAIRTGIEQNVGVDIIEELIATSEAAGRPPSLR